ncbi:hypothetical protein [Streptomyces sp. SID4985]|uniref:hypothetical protein n=1 Tax=unclassified Streptomyces TaxID=2593676 RepID=UPI001370A2EC|nr:hypothetical protein [Streptomyces sp. SID4985]MYQ48019.1 hypothetical protein [Streptomyces sp. SID4985]
MATKTDVTKTDDERAPEEAPVAEAPGKEAPEAESGTGLVEPSAEDHEETLGEDADESFDESFDEDDSAAPREKTGVGQGAAAVVSAALGLVSLNGGWIGTLASARAQLIGQLQTSSSASVAQQIKAVYGDSWHATALWAGLFAVAALVTGVVVLIRPAFGAPGRPQAPWIKSVAWAGVSLGVIGLLLAVLKYSDALLGLPSAS